MLSEHENMSEEEQIYIDKLLNDLQNQVMKLYPDGKQLRQTHPKMHGFVKAEFTISDNLPEDLKTGIFKESKTYQASIRFSNAGTKIGPDKKKDVRGAAIKLHGVPGEKLVEDPAGAGNHDFVMIDSDVFMAKNLKEYYHILHAIIVGKLSILYILFRPAIIFRLVKLQKSCADVLNSSYWSALAYKFGEGRAVKYHLQPANNVPLNNAANPSDPDYLRTNMKKTLSEQDVYFDFFVQFQTNPETMPIEDSTVPWTSPFIKLATIRIPKQTFDTKENDETGENLTFSPWHAIKEHMPVGALNRARKILYLQMARFRHRINASR